MQDIIVKDEKWRGSFNKLVEVVEANLPEGFEKIVDNGMLGYVVPLSTYPAGYHVTEYTPLPFLGIAAQKRHLALYHLGIYADGELLKWFQDAYSEQVPTKLNMGKSCIRFTNDNHIPYALIGELVARMTLKQWIEIYEAQVKR